MIKPNIEQIAFDAYYEIADLPILHTDAVCAIISKAIRDGNVNIIAELENYRSIAEREGAPIVKSQLDQALIRVEQLEFENERLKGLINIRDTKIIRLAKKCAIV